MPARNSCEKPPIYGPSPPKAMEYPTTTQTMDATQQTAKTCIRTLSTFFLRTMPP